MDKKTEAFLLAEYKKNIYQEAKNSLIEASKTINIVGKNGKVCIHNIENECCKCIEEVDKNLSKLIF
jgi:hypothetical protein